MREYVPCPNTSNIEVWVNIKENYNNNNNKLLGLYILTEAMNMTIEKKHLFYDMFKIHN